MAAQSNVASGVAQDRRWDDAQFRVMAALGFPVFLVGAIAMRLNPRNRQQTQPRSVFAQAWEASGTAAQIAFSG